MTDIVPPVPGARWAEFVPVANGVVLWRAGRRVDEGDTWVTR